MLRFFPPPVAGVILSMVLAANLLFWAVPFFAVTLVKLVTPGRQRRTRVTHRLADIAELWIRANNRIFRFAYPIKWTVTGVEGLRRDEWYLISSNHLSSIDVPVLQQVFVDHIPFIRFFIKRPLIWVPILGQAWWALDMPFMRRHSRSYLEKHPEKRGDDLAATRRACAHFQSMPTSILNYVEGTRLTPEKHAAQESPYAHLLRPRAGGLAYAIAAMGELFTYLLDVTIVYPDGPVTMWELVCGRLRHVIVHVEKRTIPPDFVTGDYVNDPEFRTRVQSWLKAMWIEKDQLIGEIQGEAMADRARI